MKTAQADIKKANAQVKKVYKNCQKSDKAIVQNYVKEYEDLYRDLYKRINTVPTVREVSESLSTNQENVICTCVVETNNNATDATLSPELSIICIHVFMYKKIQS